jgi:exodeoxyribonuclease-3
MPTLLLLSWNVNGLRAIYKKGFVDWLRGDMPDVLCLQETKVAADQVPAELKCMPGYFSYFGSGERKGRDGVALFSKTEPLIVKYTLGIEGFDDEHRAIVADYGQFLLFVVYFPNGKASQERLEYKLRAGRLLSAGTSILPTRRSIWPGPRPTRRSQDFCRWRGPGWTGW